MNLVNQDRSYWKRANRSAEANLASELRRERLKCLAFTLLAFLLACAFLAVILSVNPVELYQ